MLLLLLIIRCVYDHVTEPPYAPHYGQVDANEAYAANYGQDPTSSTSKQAAAYGDDPAYPPKQAVNFGREQGFPPRQAANYGTDQQTAAAFPPKQAYSLQSYPPQEGYKPPQEYLQGG